VAGVDPFVAKVRAATEEYGLLAPGDGVVIGVSGGPDSLALLLALKELSADYRLQLTVAHLDHGLRGTAAEADAAFVGQLSTRLGLPIVLGKADVPALAEARGLGPEEAAREARYAFLAQVAEDRHARKVAVGHTQNDQAETVLIRLIRGTGTDGLAGMAAARPLGTAILIRPLLEVTREETEGYCRRLGLVPREDATNHDSAYVRNRVRSRLLPILIGEFNPSVVAGLADLARRMGDESRLLQSIAGEAFRRVAAEDELAGVRLDLKGLLAEPPAIGRRLVRHAVRLVGEGSGPAAERVEAALDLALRGRTGGVVQLGAGCRAVRESDSLTILPSAGPRSAFEPLSLPVPGRADLVDLGLAITAEVRPPVAFPGGAGVGPGEAYLDADAALGRSSGGLLVRPRRAGDAFHPQGAPGRRKLKDFLIDRKVSRREREAIPIVVRADDPQVILWVAGHRLDEAFTVTSKTRRLLHLKLFRPGP
jgi:tRNA(Ile)-lysidine synthase